MTACQGCPFAHPCDYCRTNRKISRSAWLEVLSTPLAGVKDFLLRVVRRVDDNLATFAADDGAMLRAAAPGPVTASPAERTISGLVVPFGPAGATSGGLLTFGAGSLRWSEPKRVKLLTEHDQRESVGFATSIEERADGVWATFSVPEGPEGDRALRQAANGVRDAFSVGVMLDASVQANLRRSPNGKPVKGTGDLREVSLVSVPAFDAARVDSVAASAASDLVVSAWADPNERNTPMPCDRCGHVHPNGVVECQAAQANASGENTTTNQDAQGNAQASASTDAGSSAASGTATASGGGGTAAPRPQVVAAAAGNAFVGSEESVYTFNGGPTSLVRDAYRARMEGDQDAADRIRRFNAQVRDENPATVQALALAAVDTTQGDGANLVPTLHRPDLMRAMIDRARPFVSRLTTVPITDATPFNIPDAGDFSGVAEHVEGTAHAAEGDLALSGTPVQPRATSGAYRISRELVDASNPAIDRIAFRKMIKDYRNVSETKAVNAAVAAAGAAILNVTTVMELRAQLLAFINDDDEMADFVALSGDLLTTLAGDVDGTGRPHLPAVGPMNAVGTWKPGGTGSTVENAELVRAGKVPAAQGLITRAEGVYWFESATQQFTFSEVEGPGVVKLALWGYTAAAVPDGNDVALITSAAA